MRHILGFALAAISYAGAPTWTGLHPLGTPPSARADASAVYLSTGNQMILFGGNTAGCTSTPSLNDTWALTGANGLTGTPTWTQLVPAGAAPAVRRGHSAVYSSTSDRMIVFGGDSQGCSTLKYSDVWILDHASGATGSPTWFRLDVTGGEPPERSEHVAVYDPTHNRMTIFGGSQGPGDPSQTDAWVLTFADGTGGTPQWTQLAPTGAAPVSNSFSAGTYDPKSNRLTAFGGSVCCTGTATNQVWVLTNANGLGGTPAWIQLGPAGTAPSPRAGAQGNYTRSSNSALYFGGSGTNELWKFAGANGVASSSWSKVTAKGAAPAGRGGVVANPAAAYDTTDNVSIFFGGAGQAGMFNDTWILSAGGSSPGPSGIWVLDTDNHRVQKFNAGGVYQSQFGGFDLPTGITADATGNLYVKDGNHNCQADKFDSKGNSLLQFGACSTYGIGPGIFDNTGKIAADSSGNLWVTSPDFYYMQKYDSAGNYLAIVCMTNVGVPACPVTNPSPVQPMGVASDSAGNIYLTNVYPLPGGYNVVKFNSAGTYVSTFGSSGSGNGQFNDPEGIAIDKSGNIYVADSRNNRIQRFDANGNYLSQFGSAGSGNGQFSYPVGIAFDSTGNIYITDVGNNRVQKFDANGNYLSQFGSYGGGNGQFFAPYGVVVR